jgi:predicted PurR-regulated permease PerM
MEQTSIYRYPVLVKMAALVIVLTGIMFAGTLVNSLLLSFFIAINVSRPIIWLQEKKVPKGLAITGVFLSIILVLGVFGQLISNSFSSFSEDLPGYERNVKIMMQSVSSALEAYGIELTGNQLFSDFDPSSIMSTMSGLLSDLGGVMGNTFTILFLTLFLLFELETIPLKLDAIASNKESFSYLEGIGKSIRHYLSIKTITSALTGLLIWISLEIVGVDYAIIWAVIAFLLNFIPNIGSIIAAVPAVLFALVQLGWSGAVWTVVVFLAANMVIGNVVEPKMMGKGLGLSTFVVFLSLIFWGFLLGTVGMFLSVPLTMALKIAFEQNPETRWAAILLGTEEDAKKATNDSVNTDS